MSRQGLSLHIQDMKRETHSFPSFFMVIMFGNYSLHPKIQRAVVSFVGRGMPRVESPVELVFSIQDLTLLFPL